MNMDKPHLIDPRTIYYTGGFAGQDIGTKEHQEQMDIKPDCGEESYVGHEKLLNRTALITGGDSGIGRAVAIAFAREGANVAIQHKPGEENDAQVVKKLIEAAGRQALLLPYDLREAQAATKIVEETLAQFGQLDILVLNSAQQVAVESLGELTIQQVKDTFQVNVISMYETIKAAEPHLPPGSAIITTTSVQADNPSPIFFDYSATKGAIDTLTVNFAKYLGKKGIRVNAVKPGPVWTPIQLGGGQLPENLKDFGQHTILGRAGQPAELAPVYVLLASNDASFITGQLYGVTGG